MRTPPGFKVASELGHRIIANAGKQSACLQAGDEEHHAFDHVDEEIPEEDALDPRRGADEHGAIPTDVKSRRYGRQHARTAEMLRRPIGNEGR
jgi:hypothetical protein